MRDIFDPAQLEQHVSPARDIFDPSLLDHPVERGEGGQPAPNRTRGQEFRTGLTRGTEMTLSGIEGVAAIVARQTGNNQLAEEFEAGLAERRQTMANNPASTAFMDIGDHNDFMDWAVGGLGQLAPSIAASYGGGGIGGMIGKRLFTGALRKGLVDDASRTLVAQGMTRGQANRAVQRALRNPETHKQMIRAAMAGTVAGAFTASAAPYAAQAYGDLMAGGAVGPAEASKIAGLAGTAGGALDAAPVAVLLSRFFPKLTPAMSKSFVRDVAKVMGTQTLLEGGTEGLQEVVQIAALAYADPSFDFDAPGNRDRIIEAAALGALAGAVTGGAGGVALGSQNAATRITKRLGEWSQRKQQEHAESLRELSERWEKYSGQVEDAIKTGWARTPEAVGAFGVSMAAITRGQQGSTADASAGAQQQRRRETEDGQEHTIVDPVAELRDFVIEQYQERLVPIVESVRERVRHAARQAGLVDTSVGAQQVRLTTRVLREMDGQVAEHITPLLKQLQEQIQAIAERLEADTKGLPQDAVAAEVEAATTEANTLYEQFAEQMNEIIERAETEVAQRWDAKSEQQVADELGVTETPEQAQPTKRAAPRRQEEPRADQKPRDPPTSPRAQRMLDDFYQGIPRGQKAAKALSPADARTAADRAQGRVDNVAKKLAELEQQIADKGRRYQPSRDEEARMLAARQFLNEARRVATGLRKIADEAGAPVGSQMRERFFAGLPTAEQLKRPFDPRDDATVGAETISTALKEAQSRLQKLRDRIQSLSDKERDKQLSHSEQELLAAAERFLPEAESHVTQLKHALYRRRFFSGIPQTPSEIHTADVHTLEPALHLMTQRFGPLLDHIARLQSAEKLSTNNAALLKFLLDFRPQAARIGETILNRLQKLDPPKPFTEAAYLQRLRMAKKARLDPIELLPDLYDGPDVSPRKGATKKRTTLLKAKLLEGLPWQKKALAKLSPEERSAHAETLRDRLLKTSKALDKIYDKFGRTRREQEIVDSYIAAHAYGMDMLQRFEVAEQGDSTTLPQPTPMPSALERLLSDRSRPLHELQAEYDSVKADERAEAHQVLRKAAQIVNDVVDAELTPIMLVIDKLQTQGVETFNKLQKAGKKSMAEQLQSAIMQSLQKRTTERMFVQDATNHINSIMAALTEAELVTPLKGVLGRQNLRDIAMTLAEGHNDARDVSPRIESLTSGSMTVFQEAVDADGNLVVMLAQRDRGHTVRTEDESNIGLTDEQSGIYALAGQDRLRVREIGQQMQRAEEYLNKDGEWVTKKWNEPSEQIRIYDVDSNEPITFGQVIPWKAGKDGKPTGNTLAQLAKVRDAELYTSRMLGFGQPTVEHTLVSRDGGHVILATPRDDAPTIWFKDQDGSIPVTEYIGRWMEAARRGARGYMQQLDGKLPPRAVLIEDAATGKQTRYDLPTLVRMGSALAKRDSTVDLSQKHYESVRRGLVYAYSVITMGGNRLVFSDPNPIAYDFGAQFEGGDNRYFRWDDVAPRSPSWADAHTMPGLAENAEISRVYRARLALGEATTRIHHAEARLEELQSKDADQLSPRESALLPELQKLVKRARDRGTPERVTVLADKKPEQRLSRAEIDMLELQAGVRVPEYLHHKPVKHIREHFTKIQEYAAENIRSIRRIKDFRTGVVVTDSDGNGDSVTALHGRDGYIEFSDTIPQDSRIDEMELTFEEAWQMRDSLEKAIGSSQFEVVHGTEGGYLVQESVGEGAYNQPVFDTPVEDSYDPAQQFAEAEEAQMRRGQSPWTTQLKAKLAARPAVADRIAPNKRGRQAESVTVELSNDRMNKVVTEFVTRAANAMGLSHAFTVTQDPNKVIAPGESIDSMPRARVVMQGNQATIFLNPKRLKLTTTGKPAGFVDAVNAVAHEIGHVVFWDYWHQLNNDSQDALIHAWMREEMPHADPSIADTIRSGSESYAMRQFEEWMADQFIAYARMDSDMALQRTSDMEVRGWFVRLADRLQALWQLATKWLGLTQEYHAFADGIRATMSPDMHNNNFTPRALLGASRLPGFTRTVARNMGRVVPFRSKDSKQSVFDNPALQDMLWALELYHLVDPNSVHAADRAHARAQREVMEKYLTAKDIRDMHRELQEDSMYFSAEEILLPLLGERAPNWTQEVQAIMDKPETKALRAENMLAERGHWLMDQMDLLADRPLSPEQNARAETARENIAKLVDDVGAYYKLPAAEQTESGWNAFSERVDQHTDTIMDILEKSPPPLPPGEQLLERGLNIHVSRISDSQIKGIAEDMGQWLAIQSILRGGDPAKVTALTEQHTKEIADSLTAMRKERKYSRNKLPDYYGVRHVLHQNIVSAITPEQAIVRNMEDGRGTASRIGHILVDKSLKKKPAYRDYVGVTTRLKRLERAFRSGNSQATINNLAEIGEATFFSLNARIRTLADKYPSLKPLVPAFRPAAGTQGTSIRQRVFVEGARFRNAANDVIDALSPEQQQAVLREMISGERQSTHAKHLEALFEEMHTYGTRAGMPIRKVPKYWPRMLNQEKILADPDTYADRLMEVMGWDQQLTWNFLGGMISELSHRAERVKDRTEQGIDGKEEVLSAPWAERLMKRDLTDAQWEQIFGDARFDDIKTTIHEYVNSLTKAAEFNRTFGSNKKVGRPGKWDRTGKLKNALGRARSEGLTQQEYAEIQVMVDTLVGRVGIDMKPWQRTATSAAILYQNVRLLMFSVFSSFPDMATTVVRANSYKTVRDAWSKDLRNYWDKDSEIWTMARAWGVAADAMTQQVLAEYSSSNFLDGWAKNVSEKYFKAIGLNAWTNFTRVMALAVGRQFITEHAQNARMEATTPEQKAAKADSVAKLKEIGLTEKDVRLWADEGFGLIYGPEGSLDGDTGGNSVEILTASKKVRDALVRFSDEAVLRPDASQRPTWSSDPRFVVLWHLKSFMYAFHETLNKRVFHEMTKAGPGGPLNLLPLMHAALVFPLALLGLELREIIQYRMGGRTPRSRQLPPIDRALDLTQRTGVLGPVQMASDMYGSTQRRNPAWVGVAGPTVSQLHELWSRPWTQSGPKSVPVASQIPWLRQKIRPAFQHDD